MLENCFVMKRELPFCSTKSKTEVGLDASAFAEAMAEIILSPETVVPYVEERKVKINGLVWINVHWSVS